MIFNNIYMGSSGNLVFDWVSWRGGYAPGYAPYIYIYEQINYFLGYAPGVCAAIFGITSFPRKANGSPKALPCYFWVCAGYAPGTKNSTSPLPDPEAPKTVGLLVFGYAPGVCAVYIYIYM